MAAAHPEGQRGVSSGSRLRRAVPSDGCSVGVSAFNLFLFMEGGGGGNNQGSVQNPSPSYSVEHVRCLITHTKQ